MTIYFSKSKNGFFRSEIHGDNKPEDCRSISEEVYLSLIEQQSLGKLIKSDEQGLPIAVDNIPSLAALMLDERIWRDSELRRADVELNKVQDSDPKSTGSVSDWRLYRKALRAYPEHPEFPSRAARPTSP
ncbi:hypothetical protein D3C85_173330 [compost metagenome]